MSHQVAVTREDVERLIRDVVKHGERQGKQYSGNQIFYECELYLSTNISHREVDKIINDMCVSGELYFEWKSGKHYSKKPMRTIDSEWQG